MKYCTKCGAQIHDEAVVCTSCGAPVASRKPKAASVLKKAQDVKSAKTMAIVSLIVAGVYAGYGMFTVMMALLPLGLFGVLLSIFFGFIEFGIFVAALIVNIISILKVTKVVKEISVLPECEEKTKLEREMNTAKLLAYIGLAATCICVTFIGFIELILLLI